jgi:hypothetical protein
MVLTKACASFPWKAATPDWTLNAMADALIVNNSS